MCLGGMDSSGPHFQQGSKTAGTIAGPRFLGGGYLVFAVAASSAGNSYSAWIRSEANDVVAGGHVQDHWNTSYSVFARVPTAGRYWLLLQLDWEACDGVREDGLRDDSVLGFDVGTSQGILPGHSQGAQEWTKERVQARSTEWRGLAKRFPYRGVRNPPYAFDTSAVHMRPVECTAERALAPGHFRLVPAPAGDPIKQRGAWVPPVCGPLQRLNVTTVASVLIGVGDSRTSNFLTCLGQKQGSGPGGASCAKPTRQALVPGADEAFLDRWALVTTDTVRVNGLDPDTNTTLKLLLQVKGVVCEEARKLAGGRYAAELPAIRSHQPAVAFWRQEVGNAKKSGKHREVTTYIDTRMCPGVPRAALKRVAVMVSCGVHCAFRSPLHVYTKWVFEAAKVMSRLMDEGYGRWFWQESVGAAEHAFSSASIGQQAADFAWKHWRMTDARVRLFDVLAMHIVERAGVPVLRGFYWPAKIWPKTAQQNKQRQEYDRAWWEPAPASFEERGSDSRHFAREADLAPVGSSIVFRA